MVKVEEVELAVAVGIAVAVLSTETAVKSAAVVVAVPPLEEPVASYLELIPSNTMKNFLIVPKHKFCIQLREVVWSMASHFKPKQYPIAYPRGSSAQRQLRSVGAQAVCASMASVTQVTYTIVSVCSEKKGVRHGTNTTRR